MRILCLSDPRLRVEDPIQTLSALARPGKALALEAQIELWSAFISRHAAFQFLETTPLHVELSNPAGAVYTALHNETMAGCHDLPVSRGQPREESLS